MNMIDKSQPRVFLIVMVLLGAAVITQPAFSDDAYASKPVGFDLFFRYSGQAAGGACQGSLVGRREVDPGLCKRLAPQSGESCCLAAIATAGHCVTNFSNGKKQEFASVDVGFPGGGASISVLNDPGRLAYQLGGTADVAAIRFTVPCNFLGDAKPAKIAQIDSNGRTLIKVNDVISARKRDKAIGLNKGGGKWMDAYLWKFDPGAGPGHTGASGTLSDDGRIVGGDSGGPVMIRDTGEWIAPIASVPTVARDADGSTVGYASRFNFDAHAAGFMRKTLQAWGLDRAERREVAENKPPKNEEAHGDDVRPQGTRQLAEETTPSKPLRSTSLSELLHDRAYSRLTQQDAENVANSLKERAASGDLSALRTKIAEQVLSIDKSQQEKMLSNIKNGQFSDGEKAVAKEMESILLSLVAGSELSDEWQGIVSARQDKNRAWNKTLKEIVSADGKVNREARVAVWDTKGLEAISGAEWIDRQIKKIGYDKLVRWANAVGGDTGNRTLAMLASWNGDAGVIGVNPGKPSTNSSSSTPSTIPLDRSQGGNLSRQFASVLPSGHGAWESGAFEKRDIPISKPPAKENSHGSGEGGSGLASNPPPEKKDRPQKEPLARDIKTPEAEQLGLLTGAPPQLTQKAERGEILKQNHNQLKAARAPIKRDLSHLRSTLPSEVPQGALSAVEKCIGCHSAGSGRNLILPENPRDALSSLKAQWEKQPSHVNMDIVLKMMRGENFAAAGSEEQAGLLSVLLGKPVNTPIADLIAEAVKRDLGPVAKNVPQIVPEKQQALRAMMPETDNPVLNAIMKSPDTVFMEGGDLPSFYQSAADQLGAGEGLVSTQKKKLIPIGAGYKNIEDSLHYSWEGTILNKGKVNGVFGAPVGLDGTDRSKYGVIKFIRLGNDGKGTLPIGWWQTPYSVQESPPKAGSKFSSHIIDHDLPIGSYLGEAIYVVDPDGKKRITHVQYRRRTPGFQQQVDIYKPFPEATDMADAITRRWPDEVTSKPTGPLAKMVEHLKNPKTLVRKDFKDNYFADVIETTGGSDNLPALPADKVTALLTGETFKSSLRKSWKESGDLVSYAPTTSSAYHVVPQNFSAHAVGVSQESCRRCHSFVGVNGALLFPNARNKDTGSRNPESYISAYGSPSSMNFTTGNLIWREGASGDFFQVKDNRYERNGSPRFRGDWVQQGLIRPITNLPQEWYQ